MCTGSLIGYQSSIAIGSGFELSQQILKNHHISEKSGK